MLWLAVEPTQGAQWLLCLPRRQPASLAAREAWLQQARKAARLSHPRLAATVEVGVAENWPYTACERQLGVTLEEHLAQGEPPAPAQCAQWLSAVLEGLAYAHEAGHAHHDIGTASVLITPQGEAMLLGLGVAGFDTEVAVADGAAPPAQNDPLQAHRAATETDLAACGVLLHRLLAGAPPLDETDAPTAVQRLEREIVRLGWTMPHPVPESLRAIVNRATDRDGLRRYLGARSLLRALQGWLAAQAAEGDGPLALLLDRLQSVGHLPARLGLTERLSQLAVMERQRVDELVELLVQDPALVLELLRAINAVKFAGHDDGPVRTVRRAVQLIGMAGVRTAAASLRAWPGPLSTHAAQALDAALREALIAGHVAEVLCPADLDAEEALLLAMLQHLGGLLARYHFPDEAEQIERLAHPLAEPGRPAPRPMSPEAAASAVLGCDLASLGIAVARHWGMDDGVLHAMRPCSLDAAVRQPDDRHDILRTVASAATEAAALAHHVPAHGTPARGAAPSPLARVVQRYARPLGLTLPELTGALQRAHRLVDAVPLGTAMA